MFESVGRKTPIHRRRRAGAILMSTLFVVSLGSLAALSGDQLVEDVDDALTPIAWVEPVLPRVEAPPPQSGGSAPAVEAPSEQPPPEDPPAVPPIDEFDDEESSNDAVANLDPIDTDPEAGLGDGGGSGPGTGPGDCEGGPCDEGPPGTGGPSGDGTSLHWSELSFKLQKKPRFPDMARQMNLQEETCIVKVYFDADGRYYNHAIQDCHHAFHREIDRVVPRWQIRPYTINGEATPTVAVIPIIFRLR